MLLTISDPEMVTRAGEFGEGFILKVGLAWSLHRSHEHDSSKRCDSRGAEREIHVECKAGREHAQRHVQKGKKGLR